MQILGAENSGQDDRSNAWIFTCDRWADWDTYIQLPINPQTFEVNNPLRASQGESQNGRFMYVFRNPKSRSIFKPCNYTFEIPSGCILPGWSQEYIQAAQDAALKYGQLALIQDNNTRQRRKNGLTKAITQEVIDQQYDILSSYRAGRRAAAETIYSAREPTDPNNVQNYLANKKFHSNGSGKTEMGNIPPLYRKDIPVTLQNLWAFMCLMEEPRVFKDSNGIQRNNRIIVHLSTLVMPSMTMYGWPDAGGLKMSESAETPEITLSFDLFITGSSPSFGYLGFDSQVNTYKAEIAAPTESLDRIQAQLMGDLQGHIENNLGTYRGR
jgi:hypothetical protein